MARGAWYWVQRTLTIVISTLLVLAILAALTIYVLSSTDWGHERVRRIAQNALANMIHGKVSIGRVSGNLLTGVTLNDVTITDSIGQPFISVKSFSGRYSIMALARHQIWIDGAVAVRPVIVLDKPPSGDWNWERIFASGPSHRPSSGPNPWLQWIRFTDASVINGQLIVRSPWHPSRRLSTPARDSVVRSALAGHTRLMIEKVAGGFQKIVKLDSVTARFPLLRLTEPGQRNSLLEVASLKMNAYPFRPPAAIVRDMKGVFPFTDDSVWWKGAYAELPQSKASGDGSYVFSSGDMTLSLHGDPTSFADMQWVYPRLPAEGRGSGDLKLKWRGALQDYMATNTNVTLGKSHLSGAFGITLGDTITIHDTKMNFAGLDTRTLERLIADFKSPRQGTFSGYAELHGGRHAMAVNGDVTFVDRAAGLNRVTGAGEVGFLEHGGLGARNLRLRLHPVQVAIAKSWYRQLPIGGSVVGSATIDGSTRTQLVIKGDLEHQDRGTRSVADGSATIRLSGRKQFDVNVNVHPVSLVELGRFFPAVGLQGTATGPVQISGTLADLHVNGDLRLPDGGRFIATGALDLASKEMGYDLAASLYTLNLRTVSSKAPVTSLTARAMIRGRGTDLATMRSSLVADLASSRWQGQLPSRTTTGRVAPTTLPLDSIAVDTASVRASIANGLVFVEKLYAISSHVLGTATGTFGVTRQQRGTLTYAVATDSLGAFNRWFPKNATATGRPVPPRPQNVARAFERARADSTRVARATEMERLISGKPGPQLVVNAPKPVPADTLSGKLSASGTLAGNIYDLDLHGKAKGQDVVARGNYVHRLDANYDLTHVRTPQASIVVSANADSLSAMGFAFDTVSAKLTYAATEEGAGGGHAEIAVNQGQNRHYEAKGDYSIFTDRKEVRLATLALRFDTTSWSMTRPSTVQWGGPGVRVNDFELRNRGNGRVYAHGLLPTEGVADFALAVDSFPVANLVDILQTDLKLTGVASVNGRMNGTLAAPSFRGTFGLTQGTYNGVTVPTLTGRFGYADRTLVAHADAQRKNGQSMATIDGRIPINLALTGVTGSRLLPDPMSVDLVADSLPLELVPQFTDIVSNLHGRASGKVSMRGKLDRPSLTGSFALDHGSVTLNATGAQFGDLVAIVRMANDTVYVDSVTARTPFGRKPGTVQLKGTLGVGSWREPSLNLTFIASGAQLLNTKHGRLRMDAGLTLTGPFREAYLSGEATLVEGVLYVPEPGGQHYLVGASDPALYSVIDTTLASDRDLFPTPSPLVKNLRVEIALSVRHDTWVRNRETNVEIYTDDPVNVRQEQQGPLLLTGVVNTDRGEYETLSKRFQVKRGSAMFIGSPDLDPTLQITGEYQVTLAARGALNIRVIVGGTMRHPKLALESDAQPPKTQSELLSLLAFGVSANNLISSTTSSISGTGATTDLLGVGAQAAAQRLAGVAMGVAVQQVEMQAGRGLGADVFDITPGDVPIFNPKGSALSSFFTQTRIEVGKYVNPRTFVSAQEQAYRPGLSIEHRTADGWRFNVNTAPRILLLEPTLSLQPHRTVQSYGGFVMREWRF